jgi:hypothetical protein
MMMHVEQQQQRPLKAPRTSTAHCVLAPPRERLEAKIDCLITKLNEELKDRDSRSNVTLDQLRPMMAHWRSEHRVTVLKPEWRAADDLIKKIAAKRAAERLTSAPEKASSSSSSFNTTVATAWIPGGYTTDDTIDAVLFGGRGPCDTRALIDCVDQLLGSANSLW